MKNLAILGTGSDVGKSIVVTALCRIFKRKGILVAPFKAQNMSNNSYVTLDGGEMGRAQIAQAEAAGLEPCTDMNPVLLKPSTDIGSQIILQGKVLANKTANNYFKDTSYVFSKAKESLFRIIKLYDMVLIEGAGSCAEVNLRFRDFVNFETAHAADAPVILVADINKGGVFAQIIGTLDVIPKRDRDRVAGFIINKFRGDPKLFRDGIDYIEERTKLPVLGLVPYFRHIEIDSEDAMPLETVIDPISGASPDKINIATIRLPHISNFTDFNALIRDTNVSFCYLSKPRKLFDYDMLIIPGTKNVRFDMSWLNKTGWTDIIKAYAGSGGKVFGVCGGYQILGRIISDPYGMEGPPGDIKGLGLLNTETVLGKEKVLSRVQGALIDDKEINIEGYEIHMGITKLLDDSSPFIRLHLSNKKKVNKTDGAISSDGRISGTYLHGIFDAPEFRHHFLKGLDTKYTSFENTENIKKFKESQYELLADFFEKHLDMSRLYDIIS